MHTSNELNTLFSENGVELFDIAKFLVRSRNTYANECYFDYSAG